MYFIKLVSWTQVVEVIVCEGRSVGQQECYILQVP